MRCAARLLACLLAYYYCGRAPLALYCPWPWPPGPCRRVSLDCGGPRREPRQPAGRAPYVAVRRSPELDRSNCSSSGSRRAMGVACLGWALANRAPRKQPCKHQAPWREPYTNCAVAVDTTVRCLQRTVCRRLAPSISPRAACPTRPTTTSGTHTPPVVRGGAGSSLGAAGGMAGGLEKTRRTGCFRGPSGDRRPGRAASLFFSCLPLFWLFWSSQSGLALVCDE